MFGNIATLLVGLLKHWLRNCDDQQMIVNIVVSGCLG